MLEMRPLLIHNNMNTTNHVISAVLWLYEHTWSASVTLHLNSIFCEIFQSRQWCVDEHSKMHHSLFFSSATLLDLLPNISSCVLVSRRSISGSCMSLCVLSLQTWFSAVLFGGCFERCHMTPRPCCFCEWQHIERSDCFCTALKGNALWWSQGLND